MADAIISASLQVLLDRLASREVLDFFKGPKNNDVEELLNKLKITLTTVNGLLDDAEERQITKQAVKDWVIRLKDATYDAEDLLDQIAYEDLKLKLEAGSETRAEQMQKIFCSTDPFRKGLEKILERLEFLVKQKDALSVRERIGEKQSLHRTTTSLVDESDVYGRDADKEAVIKMVLQSESDVANGNKLVVVPIVGMGGVGKTTLAQLVYSDVQQRFDLKAWVCVSEEKDPFVVTKHILKEVFTSLNWDGMTPNQLHLELKSALAGKKFLFVLDDVWNDSSDFWEDLQRPLKYGAQGSVILMTTRIKSVAAVMGTVPAYYLKELDDDDSWLLFVKHAFADEDLNARPDLEVVGRSILKKCKGLPLAAKSLGCLLRSKRDVKEWENILKSNLWDLPNDKIIPPLKLSYHYLPSHLKRCFAYCALFPKDYRFRKEELILLWMAEGFLVPIERHEEMEEVGDHYFQDLVSRSFFSNYDKYYIMHDLMHDLAEFVSEKFYLRLEDDHLCKIAEHTRHLSSVKGWHITSKIFMEVYNSVMLRTFLLVNGQWWGCFKADKEVNDLMPLLKQLRVLSLSNFSNMVIMLDSIGAMKHLQYLNLSWTNIRILPASIQNLYNLQILILQNCYCLIELPANVVKLINLFHLDIGGTPLKEMPLQMGKLTKLQKLSYFIVGEQSGSGTSELGPLKHLRGKLCIEKLENVTNPQDALDANLKDKKHLKELKLQWNSGRVVDDSQHERIMMEQLQPHTNLECLEMVGYGGTRFADWLGDSSFSSMISLTITSCKSCFSLPPLGQLPSLKYLKISGFDVVKTVGLEFYGSSKKPFPSLESLRFQTMPQWEEWVPFAKDENDDEGGAFPVLQKLVINICPNLKKSLPSHLPCLTELDIGDCHDQIITSLSRAPRLFSLATSNWPSLDSQMGQMALFSTTLEEISIEECDSVKCFPLELFPKLKSLFLEGLRNLESLVGVENVHGNFISPKSLQIRSLYLKYCSRLKSLPQRMQSLLPSLESLTVINCPEVEWFSEEGLPSKLKSLCIEGCKKLVASYRQWNLQLLSSLSELCIADIEDVESFPEKMLLPSTLAELRIENFENLKSLNYEGLQHLINLADLEIVGCSKLQRLPEQGLPSSLNGLEIIGCPLLEQRCQPDNGEDWPKIAHIPHSIW